MRASLLKRPRTWIAIALGATAVAVAGLVWSPQLSEHDARANASDTASSPADARDLSTRKAEESTRAPASPAYGDAPPAFFRDYFDRNYYAYYFYAPPPRDAGWAPGPQPQASPFTLTSVGKVWELYRLPSSALSLSVPNATTDISKLAPLPAVRVPAPPPPKGLLTNETPFHLFVTSESVAPSSAESFGSSALAPAAAAVPSASSLTGAATGVTGTVNTTAGSLLRR